MNKSAIEALDQVRRVRLDRRDRARACSSVLEQAQGAGQKAQQDAQIGQGSIFDLGDGAATAAAPRAAFARRRTRRSPARSSTRRELLAVEKEAIGLFISAHPLKEVREALRATVDCPLARARRQARRRVGDGRRHHHRRRRRSARRRATR